MSNIHQSYDIQSRIFSPVFLCWASLLYYIDFMRKIGYGDNPYGFGFNRYYLAEVAPPLAITAVYLFTLFHYSVDIEKIVPPLYRKLQPIVYSVILVVLIIANAVMFGASNKSIIVKLGFISLVSIFLMLRPMFSTDSSNINETN